LIDLPPCYRCGKQPCECKDGIMASYSGGKDSTAMLHVLLERGETPTVVEFHTGWEFDEMEAHRELVEKKTGLRIIPCQAEIPFDFQFAHMPIRHHETREVHRMGYGWPSPTRRWCTDIKTRALDRVAKRLGISVSCIGFAADEMRRTETKRQRKLQAAGRVRYPLIEAGMTEAEALAYCHRLGYDWGGLYGHFSRVSCFCCPLQSLHDFRTLRRHFPHYWKRLLAMQDRCPAHNRGFQSSSSARNLDRRFAEEDRQEVLFT